ncbi:MAG: SpoIID/LytB domain-containing protein, partial [Myxococcaceae bacterium]
MPLPEPAEPPDAGPPPLEVPPPPSARRLDVRAGEPTVPVRLMEHRREVTFTPGVRVRLVLPGNPEKVVEAPAGTPLVVRRLDGAPAVRTFRVQVSELAWADRDGIAAERAAWE